MDQTTLRRALMQRVERHDGHWLWVGTLEASGSPTLTLGPRGRAKKYQARRLMYELSIGAIPEGEQVNVVCDDVACIAPKCLTLRYDDKCPAGHARPKGPKCAECQRHWARSKAACECGKSIAVAGLAKHRKRCPGPPAPAAITIFRPADPAEIVRTVEEDLQRGIAPEDITEALRTTLGAMEIRLRRSGRNDLARHFGQADYQAKAA